MSVNDRWLLVLTDLKAQYASTVTTMTAEVVDETISRYCTDVCEGYCKSDTCCDYRRLEVLVYRTFRVGQVPIESPDQHS